MVRLGSARQGSAKQSTASSPEDIRPFDPACPLCGNGGAVGDMCRHCLDGVARTHALGLPYHRAIDHYRRQIETMKMLFEQPTNPTERMPQ